ncbi:MAG: RNA polymerase sigma factor [Bacteroidales bacterium]|jgi:RNA polymerase sigma-70 factor (ECF subfamily)|nr:RNA polymerase sigma factor [Bacteroidales bacterium]
MTRQEITEFYQEHHRRLYNISLRILRDSDEAEEVMQDTILKFVSTPGSFSSPEQVSAWLARTCIRASIDRLRRRERREAFLEEFAREEADREEPCHPEQSEGSPALPSVSEVKAAMERLPEPYGLILDLVLIEGLDYGEIAELTGRKETTLRSLYSRGRSKLVDMLNPKI